MATKLRTAALGVATCVVTMALAHGASGTAARKLKQVDALVAPGDLGSLRSSGQLALSAEGRSVYLLDGAKSELHRFREADGQEQGEAIRLLGRGFTMAGKPLWLSVVGGGIGVVTPVDAGVFELNGSLIGERRAFGLSSISRLPNGEWGVGVLQIPGTDSLVSDKDGPWPRVVSLANDEGLPVGHTGLELPSRDYSSNQAAARALLIVSAPPKRVYAIERSNYRIYELDGNLRLRATYSDSKIQQENEPALGSPGKMNPKLKEEVDRILKGSGTDLAHPDQSPAIVEAESFSHKLAILSAAWDPQGKQIVLLLDRGVVGEQYSLDMVDPWTGDVREFAVRMPEGLTEAPAQMAVGKEFIWFRSRLGGQPTLRLSREELDQTQPVRRLGPEGAQ